VEVLMHLYSTTRGRVCGFKPKIRKEPGAKMIGDAFKKKKGKKK
tara:strand:+ start:120 stop:251 length:132 start_codon:yes stop_codon:yes gene_type:complete